MSPVGVVVREGSRVCEIHVRRQPNGMAHLEGHAYRARCIAMDNQTVLRGPDKRVPPKRGPDERVLPKAQPPILMVALTFWDRS